MKDETTPRKPGICVAVAAGDDAEACAATVLGAGETADFGRTLVAVVSEKRTYELDGRILEAVCALPRENATLLCGGSSVSRVAEEARRRGFGFVVFLCGGDRLPERFSEYAECFFGENGESCRVLLAPRSPLRGAPRDGIAEAGSWPLPLSARCAALTVSALAESDVPRESESRPEEAFMYALSKTILADGRFGLLPALGGAGFGTPFAFAGTRPAAFSPRVEISRVENDFEDIGIGGVFAAAEGSPELKARAVSPAKLLRFSTSPEESEEGILRLRFSATLKPDGSGVARLRFSVGGKPVRDIRVPEKKEGRAELPFFRNYAVSRDRDALRAEKTAPRARYAVSCVVPVFDGTFLEEAAAGVAAQSIGFFENVQLVLVNDGGGESAERVCRKLEEKYPHNVTRLSHAENLGAGAARNTGLSRATGEFVSFLDADDLLDPGVFEAGVSALNRAGEEADVAVFPVKRFGPLSRGMKSSLSFVFEGGSPVDLEKEPGRFPFGVSAALLRREALSGLAFDESLRFSEDAAFMHAALLGKMKFVAVKGPAYMYRAHEGSSTRNAVRNPFWYEKNPAFGKSAAEASVKARGRVTGYTERLIAHELLSCFSTGRSEEPLSEERALRAVSGAKASLDAVSEEALRESEALSLKPKSFLLKLKRGEVRPECAESGLTFRFDEEASGDADAALTVDGITERGGVLRLVGSFEKPVFSKAEPAAFFGGRFFRAEHDEKPAETLSFFGIPVYGKYPFALEIPSDVLSRGGSNPEFVLRTETGWIPVVSRFGKRTGLGDGKGAFFAGESLLLTRAENGRGLEVEALTEERLAETAFASLEARAEGGDAALSERARVLLGEYLRARPLFAGRKTLLFSEGADGNRRNAERMFAYSAGKKDGTDAIFVAGENTPEAFRLSEIGTVVPRDSDAHVLAGLLAERIVVSGAGENGESPADPEGFGRLFAGLSNAETVLIPNGPFTEEAAKKSARSGFPFGLLIVSSESERKIAVRECGLPESAVVAAGSPSFDLLKRGEGKRILFMPAGREKLCAEEGRFDPLFADSEYLRAINGLLCDEALFDAADELGYAFDFAPHPSTRLQLSDFETDLSVNTLPPVRVAPKTIEEASLIVTDVMPVFEAVYAKKPVVLFRFAESEGLPFGARFDDPESFPLGVRFGEVADGPAEAAEAIAFHMKNGCAVSEEQKRAAEAFFARTDDKNRERAHGVLKDGGRRGLRE